MKSALNANETPSAIEQSFKPAIKLKRQLPMHIEMESTSLMKISCLVEDICVKTRETSQNTDFDLQ